MSEIVTAIAGAIAGRIYGDERLYTAGPQTQDKMRQCARAALTAIEAAGYRVVSVDDEPTDDQRRIARQYFGMNPFEPNNQPFDHIWLSAFKAMISASPKLTNTIED